LSLISYIYSVINFAYAVETGTTGYGFKSGQRLTHPYDGTLRAAYEEGRIFCAIDKTLESIVGVTYWEVTKNNGLYFGPFAVLPEMQGRGIGKLMLNELNRIAKEKSLTHIEIKVVNHRTDLIPWYESLGYKHTSISDWPSSHLDVLTRPTHFLHMVKKLE
jgi:GNAT superfamily N-acetyltransferase